MGNETSVQYREDDDKRTKSGRVLRTSSLKATQRPNYPSLQQHQKNAQSTATTTGPKKRGIGLKRASTFTSISTFSRPLFQSKLTSTSNDKQTASKFSFKKTSKCKEVTKQQKNLDVTNQIKGESFQKKVIALIEKTSYSFHGENSLTQLTHLRCLLQL